MEKKKKLIIISIHFYPKVTLLKSDMSETIRFGYR